MQILFVTAEVSPYSKAGGLADVSEALPSELSGLGEHLIVITPLYSLIDREKYKLILAGIPGEINMGGEHQSYRLFEARDGRQTRHQIFFIENETFFNRPGIYTAPDGSGFEDNTERYFFFQLCVIDLLKRAVFHPDMIHCQDHHSGLIPLIIRSLENPVPVLFTIHNFDYRGHFTENDLQWLPGSVVKQIRETRKSYFSSMAQALIHADRINTVSRTYAAELLSRPDLSFELYGLLKRARQKFSGILNGADTRYWNPLTDPHLSTHYSTEDLSGKQDNKKELQRRCGFPVDERTVLFGSIGRLVESKGYPLILACLEKLIRRGVQVIFLGSGDKTIAGELKRFAREYPRQISFNGEFNEKLAHLIEAGSDIFMMPSKFEPCGLNQIYSLKYGTVPVVHRTGGLADTVEDWDGATKGTGFVFEPYTADAFYSAIDRALSAYADQRIWQKIQLNGMVKDFSWQHSAQLYRKLYQKLIGDKNDA